MCFYLPPQENTKKEQETKLPSHWDDGDNFIAEKVCSGCCNRYHRLSDLNKGLFLIVLEAGKSKIKVWDSLLSGEGLLPVLQTAATTLLYPYGRESERTSLSCLF